MSTAIQDLQTEGRIVLEKVTTQLTVNNLVKYIVEGMAVAIAAYVIPNRRTNFNEVSIIAIIAALTLFVLDVLSADVSRGARFGAGFGMGMNLVNNAPVKLPFM